MPGSFISRDLDVFLQENDFGICALWTKVNGPTSEVRGIFEDEDIEVAQEDGTQRLMRSARFTTRTDTGIAVGDTLVIDNNDGRGDVTYRVAVDQADGTGMTTYHLEDQTA